MSGICGWSNNQLALEARSNILQQMANTLTINPNYNINTAETAYYSLASVGPINTLSIHRQEQQVAAIQGHVRWNNPELAQAAQQQNHAYAVLLGYRQQGVEFLKHLAGNFALALIDEAQQITLIATDKLGLTPVFYSIQCEQLLFSSDARAIQQHPDGKTGIDPQGIFDYLYFHMVPGPRCIFNHVEKLLPGQYLLWENQQVHKAFYWQPHYIESGNVKIDRLESTFRELIKDSIRRVADNPATGAFLSGGTDSSTIAGMLRQVKGSPVDTYSIGFNAEGFDEMEYARIATRHFDNHAHEYYLTPQDVVDAIPLIAKAYDQPFGNASAVPAYYCAKLAHTDGISTLLAGDGGDELFAGNERYAKQKVFEYYHIILQILRQSLIEPSLFNFPFAEKVWPIKKIQSYVQQANIPLPDRLETYNLLTRTALQEIFQTDFLTRVDTEEPLRLLRETYQRTPAQSSLNRMLFLDLKFTLADNDLPKVNRMCELAGVDVRYPFLDDEFLKFSAELPVALKLRGFKLRYFFKQSLKDFLPREILTKRKHGFGLPFGVWMNNHAPLREMAYDNLAALVQRGIVKAEFIDNLKQLHKQYPSYYGVTIWVLMMLEQWIHNQE
jgi:asparagine synthase (glutamine-hydrolysing)